MTIASHPFGPILSALKPSVANLRWCLAALFALALLGGGYALVLAQVSGDRGIAPTASTSDIEIMGIEVDERGDDALDAREKGWRQAQRDAWSRANGPALSDGQLSSMVSAIVIQRERVGPKRYVATLGVSFDRQRAGRFLGGSSRARVSAPMLLLPITASAGAYTAFETRNPWQRAWAGFNPGASRIDYIRPSGAGGDSLLLNFGQAGRRSRAWWRTSLDQYGAADALVPIARLNHAFPGGPIEGVFTARYGPDSKILGSFTMEAAGPDALDDMLGKAVIRMDQVYQQALADGILQPDPTLRLGGSGEVDPAIARLIEIGRSIRERDRAVAAAAASARAANAAPTTEPTDEPSQAAAIVRSITVQFATPDAAAFDAALSAVRQATGVRGLAVTSTAMGGTSVMSVSYGGEIAGLAAALRSRGFTVREGANALAISR